MNDLSLKNITLIGCGHMGGALLSRWLQVFSDIDFHVVAPSGLPEQFAGRVSYSPEIDDRVLAADLIVIAVKPQVMEQVCESLKFYVSDSRCVVSIAAGRSLSWIEGQLHAGQPVVRVMPNMPCALGVGVNGGIANRNVSDVCRADVSKLFQATGIFEWMADEDDLHAVTGVSGSGPAYIYYMVEAMARAGVEAGLAPDIAMRLARQTVVGAAAVLGEDDAAAQILRDGVTSKGGTTAAGLSVLMDGRFDDVLKETVLAAAQRSKDLSSS